MDLKKYIRDIPDFPQKGIMFRDITTLLKEPEPFKYVIDAIVDKYGNEKIGELLGKVKVTKSFEKGLKQSIGINTKDLTEKWHLYLKREHWPDIADRKEPEEFAKKLTDHVKERNFVNSGPALSPKGDKIAFLSDKSDYFDIYLI